MKVAQYYVSDSVLQATAPRPIEISEPRIANCKTSPRAQINFFLEITQQRNVVLTSQYGQTNSMVCELIMHSFKYRGKGASVCLDESRIMIGFQTCIGEGSAVTQSV